MSSHDDEFDLDVRFSGTSDGERSQVWAPGNFRTAMFAGDPEGQEETIAPQATCPAETCGLDCQTQTCPEATCGCNTSETCDQLICSDAITFGPYCEDQSDDTCNACPGGNTPGCPDD